MVHTYVMGDDNADHLWHSALIDLTDEDSDWFDETDYEVDHTWLVKQREAFNDADYATELYLKNVARVEAEALDFALAQSLYEAEVQQLVQKTGDASPASGENDGREQKATPMCSCCLDDQIEVRALPCGHIYCVKCITTRCRMGVRDRAMVPAHCCKKEYPIDYVKDVLSAEEVKTYERFLSERDWRELDLESDEEYAKFIRANALQQCPGCGVGVQRTAGCSLMTCLNGHQFCYRCGTKWKSCSCAYYS